MSDGYKRVRDPKMRWHGDIDEKKKVIRINDSKKKNQKKGELIDTIVHEETHRMHPKMHEKTVRKEAARKVASMGQKAKAKLYKKYK